MREPTWSDLVRLPERRAVERFFDARNDRFLRPALLVAGVGAAVGTIASLAQRQWLAAPWAALLLGVAAILVLRRTGEFDRRPRAYLLGFVTALIAAIAIGIPEPAAAYALTGFLVPLALVLIRLRPGQQLALAALCLVAATWASMRIEEADAPPPAALPSAALIWIAATSAVSLRFSRRLREHFLGEWRHHAALSREHSRMRSELDDARAVQLSMLPRAAPDLPWVELASTTMPATEVGGDYFGYFPLDDGRRLAIAIADVAGHGMASGLVLSGLRGGLHLLRDDMARPVEVLGRLDRMLRETSPGRMFVTLQIALLDAGRGELVVANAGHPPLLLLPAGGGEALTVGAPGPPLGTRLAPGYLEVRHRLGAGDTLVLYTDGVAELRNRSGAALGEDGLLAEAARGARAPTAREVRDVLVGALARFKGDVEAADDLTLVIARVTAAAAGVEDDDASEQAGEISAPAGDPAVLNRDPAATESREDR